VPRIGILAPYDPGETAAAAALVADLAVSRGAEVRWASPSPVRGPAFRGWDGRVTRVRSPRDARPWARDCDAFVAFEPAPWLLPLLGPSRPLSLVFCRGRLGRQRAAEVAAYRSVVFPDPWTRDAAGKAGLLGDGAEAGVCRWAPLPEPPPGPRAEGPTRVFVYAEGSAPGDDAAALAGVSEVLERCPGVGVTLARARTWPGASHREALRLASRWPDRLRLSGPLTAAARAVELGRHDWLWLPAPATDFGLSAAQGLARGVPVVALAVLPYADLVRDGVDGVLLPCVPAQGWLGAPAAVPSRGAVAGRLPGWLGEPARAAVCRPDPARPAAARAAFEAYWAGLLSLPDAPGL
jgi:hypothetical protein